MVITIAFDCNRVQPESMNGLCIKLEINAFNIQGSIKFDKLQVILCQLYCIVLYCTILYYILFYLHYLSFSLYFEFYLPCSFHSTSSSPYAGIFSALVVPIFNLLVHYSCILQLVEFSGV
jgi:hypothetical protein